MTKKDRKEDNIVKFTDWEYQQWQVKNLHSILIRLSGSSLGDFSLAIGKEVHTNI